MVDINDIVALEQQQREKLPEHVKSWALFMGIPISTKQAQVKAMYQRYVGEDKWFVQKILRSKTSMASVERLHHEAIIKRNPGWDYEVETRYGSIDFVAEVVPYMGNCIIEVKDFNSWKQVMATLLYKEFYPRYIVVAAFFNVKDQLKLHEVKAALDKFDIYTCTVQDDGSLLYLE